MYRSCSTLVVNFFLFIVLSNQFDKDKSKLGCNSPISRFEDLYIKLSYQVFLNMHMCVLHFEWMGCTEE